MEIYNFILIIKIVSNMITDDSYDETSGVIRLDGISLESNLFKSNLKRRNIIK